ncbi:collagen alpha-1(I) chain [Ailuropoda melanoleuca]|uniref:collagen alpha-1(I) chain n=1 Tax=Ailuropoda melanoleuca TaxID=9646 RepID=UPI00149434C9|nr:collagen alpha-1(I) chain [Ailuropoda melanoleuca]
MGDDGARTGMLTWVVCGLQLSYPASPRSPWRGDNTHKNPGSGKTTGVRSAVRLLQYSPPQLELLGDRPPEQPCSRCQDVCRAADARGPPCAPGTTRPPGPPGPLGPPDHPAHWDHPGPPGTTRPPGPGDPPGPPGPRKPPHPPGTTGPTGNDATTRPTWTTWTTRPTGPPGTTRLTGTHRAHPAHGTDLTWMRGDPKPPAGTRCGTRQSMRPQQGELSHH